MVKQADEDVTPEQVIGYFVNYYRHEVAKLVELALDDAVDAIVTAPIDKMALHAGGYDFPGHTEMLASRCGIADVVMMMAAETTALGGPLRVVLATTHIALAQVPLAFTADLLMTQTRITARSLRDGWHITSPHIALCAFNPHASDGGLFGDEEERIYAPAIAALRDYHFESALGMSLTSSPSARARRRPFLLSRRSGG